MTRRSGVAMFALAGVVGGGAKPDEPPSEPPEPKAFTRATGGAGPGLLAKTPGASKVIESIGARVSFL